MSSVSKMGEVHFIFFLLEFAVLSNYISSLPVQKYVICVPKSQSFSSFSLFSIVFTEPSDVALQSIQIYS